MAISGVNLNNTQKKRKRYLYWEKRGGPDLNPVTQLSLPREGTN